MPGHASWNATHESGTPGERRARQVDLDYFASRPEETSYVRRAIDDEAGSADAETRAEWASVHWVLVTIVNDRRERCPLHPAGSVLVDGP